MRQWQCDCEFFFFCFCFHMTSACCSQIMHGPSEVKVAQSCLTLYKPMDYTVHGIIQTRILEWVAFHFSRGSSQQGLNPGLPHCKWILYQLSHKGSPNAWTKDHFKDHIRGTSLMVQWLSLQMQVAWVQPLGSAN